MKFKPIETEYQGYRFRSRLEARWAVCFDTLGLEWVYEHEGFDLGPLGWYLPDFWFPLFKCWGEVKPKALTEIEFRKCKALPNSCILFDVPSPTLKRSYYLASDDAESTFKGYETDKDFWRIMIIDSFIKKRLWFEFCQGLTMYSVGMTARSIRAALAARAARFEFGESGRRVPRRTPQVHYGELPY